MIESTIERFWLNERFRGLTLPAGLKRSILGGGEAESASDAVPPALHSLAGYCLTSY
jgi:hypothetical protein